MYLHCYDRGNIQKMKVVDLTWIERDRGGGGGAYFWSPSLQC